MPTFYSQDDKEQFEEKVRIIVEEELKDIKRKEFTANLTKYIKDRSAYYKRNPEVLARFLGRNQKIDDYDYQMDVDTHLSLTNQNI